MGNPFLELKVIKLKGAMVQIPLAEIIFTFAIYIKKSISLLPISKRNRNKFEPYIYLS